LDVLELLMFEFSVYLAGFRRQQEL